MDWLANIDLRWIILTVIGLAVARIGIAKAEGIPKATSASVGEMLESLIFALVLVFLVIRPFIVQPFYIPSASMRPTLWEGDRILVSKFAYRIGTPKRGDIVVFKAPPQASPDQKDFIKRVIGLPGDTVEVRNGEVLVNGKPLDEKEVGEEYAADGASHAKLPPDTVIRSPFDFGPVTVPPNSLFVMGDNRPSSLDSRYWGPLAESRLLGKAEVIFWPPSRIGILH
jgi:signal peptidase I